MERRYVLTLALTNLLVLVFSLSLLLGQAQQTFTGSGDLTTDTFECAGICRITWTTEYPNWAEFEVEIHKFGWKYAYGQFVGLNGTTYLYGEGTFYFRVHASGITTWEITVEDVPIESLEPSTSFAGVGKGDISLNTGVFTCAEHCTITWTTEYEDPTEQFFTASINSLREEEYIDHYFMGLDGTTHFYGEGMFYFSVQANDITAWEITVKEVPINEMVPSTYFSWENPSVEGRASTFNTGIFTCAEHCRITWTAELAPPTYSVGIGVWIHQLGVEDFSDYFNGQNRTTHLYAEGTFYFEVYEQGITAWEITVEEDVPLASLEPSTSFAGVDSFNTGIFTCAGHCTITWTAEAEDPRTGFEVKIRQPGEAEPYYYGECFIESHHGTCDFYGEGTFYFAVHTGENTAWEITVEEVLTEPAEPAEPAGPAGFIPGFELLPAIAALPIALYLARRKK